MGYFEDWYEGEQNLDLDELDYGDELPDPFDGDTAIDSSFEEDYFDNYQLYQLRTDRHMRQYRDDE